MAPGPLVQREQRAPNPNNGPRFQRRQWRSIDVPAIARAVAVARMGPIPDQVPGWRAGLEPLPKLAVLLARTGHHGDEAAAGAVNVVEIGMRAQFGIGDIQEVSPPG